MRVGWGCRAKYDGFLISPLSLESPTRVWVQVRGKGGGSFLSLANKMSQSETRNASSMERVHKKPGFCFRIRNHPCKDMEVS